MQEKPPSRTPHSCGAPQLAKCVPHEVHSWAGAEVRLCSHTINTPRSRSAWTVARLTGFSVTGRINGYPTGASRLPGNATSSLPAKDATPSVGGSGNRTGSLSGRTAGCADPSNCIAGCLLQPCVGPRSELRPISRGLAPRFCIRLGRRPCIGGGLLPAPSISGIYKTISCHAGATH